MLPFCLAGFFFVSCSGNEDEGITVDAKAEVQAEVQTGTWRITKFQDSGDDETYHFSGYDFSFKDSGVLNATNGTNSYDGSWVITDSNSNDDSSDDLELLINFYLTNAFEELNEDWHFISRTSSKIELIHVSGGNGGTDYLTFEKN